jgi:hypothetical protein
MFIPDPGSIISIPDHESRVDKISDPGYESASTNLSTGTYFFRYGIYNRDGDGMGDIVLDEKKKGLAENEAFSLSRSQTTSHANFLISEEPPSL